MRAYHPLQILIGFVFWLAFAGTGFASQLQRPTTIAILDFADSSSGKRTTEMFAAKLSSRGVTLVDRDLARTAARGAGYQGSLNLSLAEARDLGAAIGCDFYFLGDTETLRRSRSTGPVYFEAYASIFLVSTRTGRLISWERPTVEAASPQEAEQQLFEQLSKEETWRRYSLTLERARDEERHDRELAFDRDTPIIEEALEDKGEANGLRSPRPFRRLKPAYPDSAARADAVGTVDVLVDLDKDGEVHQVDLVRWAGFGMDEATMDTVRQLHFFPASRDGIAIPIRVLLRYNFRRPTK
jgi:TonB family protein